MGDWTCEVFVGPDSREQVVRWHLVLADTVPQAGAHRRALELAREHYGPEARVGAVIPERWLPTKGPVPSRGAASPSS